MVCGPTRIWPCSTKVTASFTVSAIFKRHMTIGKRLRQNADTVILRVSENFVVDVMMPMLYNFSNKAFSCALRKGSRESKSEILLANFPMPPTNLLYLQKLISETFFCKKKTSIYFTCDNLHAVEESIGESPSFHAWYLPSSIVKSRPSSKAFVRDASTVSLCYFVIEKKKKKLSKKKISSCKKLYDGHSSNSLAGISNAHRAPSWR